MNVPKARKLASGTWFIQLRLGGESIPVSGATEKAVTREAMRIKAEYKAGTSERKAKKEASPTVGEAIEQYIESRAHVVSPSTVRGYNNIAASRWEAISGRRLADIASGEWQGIVNAEAKTCGAKTLRNAWGLLRSAIQFAGATPPKVRLPQVVPNRREFFTSEQIPVFVAAVKDTKYAVPLLLALSSLRISEIYALDWASIPQKPQFIRVAGAVVPNAEHKYVRKAENKNATSARNVPIIIPELAEAIERERRPSGCVSPVNQHNLRLAMGRICEKAGLPDVGIHGLRHSFASLCYHLRVPEQIAMEIGGWSDAGTMRRIYTHIAQSDFERYRGELAAYFANENANKGEKA